MTDSLYFDTDCLSAFLWVKAENILKTLYSGKIKIPQQVYNELSNPAINHLKMRLDSGEAAAIALASAACGIVASNNMKDVSVYIRLGQHPSRIICKILSNDSLT